MAEQKRRILEDIVQNVSQAKYNDVAPLLLRSKVAIEPPHDGRQRSEDELEAEKRGGKRVIWQTRIIDLLADSLYRDYLKVENDWLCAAELCQLLVSCCAASEDMTHDPHFRQSVLKKTSNGLWHLARNIYQRLDWGVDNAAITRANSAFQTVIASSFNFFLEFSDFIADAWQSPDLINMLESKLTRTLDWLLLDLCAKIAKLNRNSVFNLPSDVRQRILDACVDKLTRTDDPKLANACFQFTLAWLDAYPLMLTNLISRNGDSIKTQMQKWRGHGFDGSLNLLKNYLTTGLVADSDAQKLHEAAARIQASFRAYVVRRRIAKMKAGFAKLQQLFRIRRQKSIATSLLDSADHEIQHKKAVKRYQDDRKYWEKRLHTVSVIHASLVDQYLESEADRAATKIQALWRGYWARKIFRQRKLDARRNKAAKIIQKNMRRWYEKRRMIRNRLKEWPGLTESRREELQSIIDRYQERYKTRHLPSKQSQRELHEKAQSLLIDHYKRRYSSLNSYQKHEAALARLRLNIQLLEIAPKLSEVKPADLRAFTTQNSAVASRAARAHQEEMRFHRLPKWKQLLEKAGEEIRD